MQRMIDLYRETSTAGSDDKEIAVFSRKLRPGHTESGGPYRAAIQAGPVAELVDQRDGGLVTDFRANTSYEPAARRRRRAPTRAAAQPAERPGPWSRLVGTLTADRVFVAVVGLAIVCSVAAIAYYGSRGETLAYIDGRSRLNIARRVVDNLQPGLVQLGNIWLPLHMLLMLPFIVLDPLWHTGAAAIVFSAVSYVGVTAVIYLTVLEATGSRFGAAVAGIIVITNANFVYLQATPMSEAPFLLFYCAGFYLLLHWARSRNHFFLIMSGLLLGLSAMVRYDGWFAVATGGIAVVLIALRRGEAGVTTRSYLIAFGFIAIQGMAMFLFYNLVYFGNPLAFASTAGSGSTGYQRLAAGVTYLTKGDIVHAVAVYSWTVIDNVGAVLFLLALAGFVYALLRFRLSPTGIALYAFASGFVFNVVSLFLGQSVIRNQHLLPDLPNYNVRYGIVALPAVALFCGLLVARRQPAIRLAVVGLVIFQTLALYIVSTPVSLAEPLLFGNDGNARAARDFVRTHYDGGLILIDFNTNSDADSFYMQLPMHDFLHQGVKKYHEFDEAAGHPPSTAGQPSRLVRWIYGRTDEPLLQGLAISNDFHQNFICAFASGPNQVYKLSSPGDLPGPGCDGASPIRGSRLSR